ncbi:protein of unknown function [Chitinophaga jiangningensis]|uniref:DUF4466 domain-containing protein n=1 Tax=Chitinophaga jiangningensis TaxID=1419482 RepID=A0A1M7AMW4_9BACT|nr:DUF4466 family protein [Chitinophaga jiangningensis]SHL44015.1 protein of unknown function [Chitinophaga jiangningensis]
MRINFRSYTPALLGMMLLAASCAKDDAYETPTTKNQLQNDCIKRSTGPNISGGVIEFAYAMALPASRGKLVSAQVEASIAGANGTYLENNSYYYSIEQQKDVPVKIGEPSVTTGNTTVTTFTKDTMAATLRYFYTIPAEAKGKSVTFTFSAKSDNGENVSYKMGPYEISTMDMKLDLNLTDGDSTYFSVADMKVYAKNQTVDASKIDLIYMYRTSATASLKHALVAPGAPKEYLQDFVVPGGAANVTKLVKAYNLRDQQLARLQYGVFITDQDFKAVDFNNQPSYLFNLKAEGGTWVETADGKYRAFIYINKVDDAKKSMVISVKRYQVK